LVATPDATVVPTGECSGLDVVAVAQATLPVAVTITEGTTTATERPEFTLWAPMFQINHRASDLESASSTSTSSSGLPTASTGPDPNSNDANSPSGSLPSSDPVVSAQGGLSTGAIAGIAVGAAIGGILIAAIVGCLWWTRVRKPRQAAEAAVAAAVVPRAPSPGTTTWAEFDSTPTATEIPTKDALYYVRPELEDYRAPAELAAPPTWQTSGRNGHA
jgi:hypothetical protein